MTVSHGFGPVYDENCEILILGSFPSVKSREESFYYAHPQNRFWRTIAECCGCGTPATTAEKRALLLGHRLALWDVIERCEITGSSDASIRKAEPTDIMSLISETKVSRILLNGQTAMRLYKKFWPELTLPAVALPSTSAANARFRQNMLVDAWGKALGIKSHKK